MTKSKKGLLGIGLLDGMVLLGIVLIFGLICYYNEQYHDTAAYDTYKSDVSYINIETKTKQLATDLKLFANTLYELDEDFANTKVLDEVFTYHDWVVYGDPKLKNIDNLEWEILETSNMVSVINTNIDAINVSLYSQDNSIIRKYKYTWNNLAEDIFDLNADIEEYNKSEKLSGTAKYSKIQSIKEIYSKKKDK